MRRNITLLIKGVCNIDIDIDDELTISEILNELYQNRVILEEISEQNYLARLLVRSDIISFETGLNFENLSDGEIIYLEKRT